MRRFPLKQDKTGALDLAAVFRREADSALLVELILETPEETGRSALVGLSGTEWGIVSSLNNLWETHEDGQGFSLEVLVLEWGARANMHPRAA